MPCPFFLPTKELEDGNWPHPARLPLGCGWSGHCTAPGHEGEIPAPDEIQNFCNLGYATACGRLPKDRKWDAIRLAVTSSHPASDEASRARHIQIRYVCERAHAPADHGLLQFNLADSQWLQAHPDHRVQKMAECFLETYLKKSRRQEATQL